MSAKANILLADDSDDDQVLILLGLRKAGLSLEVQCVNDGVGAMEYLAGRNQFADREKFPLPCLLLTDIKMPRMDGLELLSWIRTQPGLRNLPVIVVTGSEHASDRQQAFDLGADLYVTKELLIQPPAGLVQAITRFATTKPKEAPKFNRLAA